MKNYEKGVALLDRDYDICTLRLKRLSDIENIEDIYKVLSYKKEMTQLICVIHNPILIYKLSKLNYINWIELSEGYLDKIKEVFNKL